MPLTRGRRSDNPYSPADTLRVMDCAPATISCELDRIADQLTGFDINGFLATLIATLIGAFVAGVVSIALYRHEVSNRRKGEIDLAVVALIREIQQYSDRLRRWRVELQAYSVNATQRIGVPSAIEMPPPGPDRAGIDTAVEALIVLTAGNERRVAERARQVLYELTFIKDEDAQATEYAAVRRVLVAWRARKRTDDEVLAALNTVDARRRGIEAGKSADELPSAPEPYERSEA